MSIVEDLLLSWERERAGERRLTASVLQARGNWTEKVTTVKRDRCGLVNWTTDRRQAMAKSAVLIYFTPKALYVLG